MTYFSNTHTFAANTINSSLAHLRLHLLLVTLIANEQYIACTVLIFGEFVFSFNVLMKQHTIGSTE